MNWFRKLMYGRAGGDQLGMALCVFSIALTIITMFIPIPLISYLSFIPLIFAIYRMFSKQIAKRQAENYKFLQKWNGVKRFFKKIVSRAKQRKTYKFYKCPSCKQEVRVPKNKGKINITCPKCKHKFIKTT